MRTPRKRAGSARKQQSRDVESLRTTGAALNVPKSPHLAAFQDDFCIAYTNKFLLRGGPVHLAFRTVDLDGQNPRHGLLRDALLTLATTFFGHQHKDDCTRQKGYWLYGSTLKALNQALGTELARSDDVLLCVVTFGLLETFVPSSQSSWLMHIRGMEKLLELRGPETYRDPFSRQILQGLRRMLIFGSLNTSIPSILARQEWKALEWRSDAIQKNTDEDLLNFLADCPALFNRRDELLRLFDNDQNASALELRTSILEEGRALLEELRIWRQEWGEDLRDTMIERSKTPSECLSNPPSGNELPMTTGTFSGSAADATTMMLYFSTHIHILDLMSSVTTIPPAALTVVRQESLDPRVFPLDLGPTAPRHLEVVADQKHYLNRLHNAALNIARIVPYHLSIRERLDAGSLHIGGMAIKLAWKAFQGEATAEGRWLKETILKFQKDLPFAEEPREKEKLARKVPNYKK
ncbi:MAG: hypothetical protein M1822_004136 [Bathelium mastoideum]|nr:MAG: hypothetical protein M1822_004136 [Bathelium mastoideum]